MYILLVFLALGSVSTHDINVGSSAGGKKVFDEHFQASPAVWRQAQNVTITTTDDEVISRIVVTDLREEKDGDAKIVDGGEGQKKVTIELKSPTVLRGYDFNVEVYAEPNKEFQTSSLNKNEPNHPSEFKTNAGNFNSPNPASEVSPSDLDASTKLPAVPKTQAFPSHTEAKTPSNARETRNTEVKKLGENKSDIDAPSVSGSQNNPGTTVKSEKDSNAPVTTSSRLFTDNAENEEITTKTAVGKDKSTDARHVRDTHEDFTKNSPITGSFDSKTDITTSTFKTPSYNNVNRNNPVASHPVSVTNDREARATQTEDDDHVSPTLVPSQRNPTVYTPNFESNVPSVVKIGETDKKDNTNDKSKNINDQKRSSRDTHDEAKENTPEILAEGLTIFGRANRNAENVTKDEERKPRDAQNGPKITSLHGDTKEVSSTTASTFANKNDDSVLENDSSDKQHSLNPQTPTRPQKYPVPYPYETTPKVAATTKSPHKRDTEPSEGSKADNASLVPKSVGSQNATRYDQKTPIVSLQ